ncbi:LysE family translocator [Chromobacterium sp. IIBBL 290-4]|uniref:LysE family translocator n=1 Tax=Chromobacterium sp. IIBBL 290-4 TaxID=2953890 RepID=UPI0020B69B40|nr:LysE family transporter [Chromobacterium sp. IIBBL 290-4]UTH73659.1 LysE family transporter [Chromobacterium sp. IIBBL 290-4]
MAFFLSVASIIAALAAGVVSPGPSFILVAQTSLSSSRKNGIAAAIGMGLGALTFATLVLIGLHALLINLPAIYIVLKCLGGGYLLYLAVRIWRGAAAPLRLDAPGVIGAGRARQSFWLALATMLSNPKAMVQYGAIFAALLPKDLTGAQGAAIALSIFALEAGWYTLVALVLSSPQPRAAYLRYKTAMDRTAAFVMLLLGIKLLAAAL